MPSVKTVTLKEKSGGDLLFYGAACVSNYIASDGRIIVNYELENIWKAAVVAYLRYYPDICLEELRKATQSLSHYSRCSGRDSNQTPPKYKSEMLLLEPTSSVWVSVSVSVSVPVSVSVCVCLCPCPRQCPSPCPSEDGK